MLIGYFTLRLVYINFQRENILFSTCNMRFFLLLRFVSLARLFSRCAFVGCGTFKREENRFAFGYFDKIRSCVYFVFCNLLRLIALLLCYSLVFINSFIHSSINLYQLYGVWNRRRMLISFDDATWKWKCWKPWKRKWSQKWAHSDGKKRCTLKSTFNWVNMLRWCS